MGRIEALRIMNITARTMNKFLGTWCAEVKRLCMLWTGMQEMELREIH